jgi:hypothetical protein
VSLHRVVAAHAPPHPHRLLVAERADTDGSGEREPGGNSSTNSRSGFTPLAEFADDFPVFRPLGAGGTPNCAGGTVGGDINEKVGLGSLCRHR